MVGAPPVVYLNVEMATMKKIASDMITNGTPVWFGCDVGQQMDGESGIWDARLHDLAGIYDTEFTLDKAARLDYHQTLMTHAMLLTGVDLVDGSPRKWRVENSWGDEHGDKGFYTMNDSWFDEYVFEIAAPKSLLPPRAPRGARREPPCCRPGTRWARLPAEKVGDPRVTALARRPPAGSTGRPRWPSRSRSVR